MLRSLSAAFRILCAHFLSAGGWLSDVYYGISNMNVAIIIMNYRLICFVTSHTPMRYGPPATTYCLMSLIDS